VSSTLQSRTIYLIGPGGAGKTTTGTALARRLAIRCVDLDAEFAARHGDISAYLKTHGYHAYAKENVSRLVALAAEVRESAVVSLSSGFMTYRDDIHPEYSRWRRRLLSNASTFVLLPSLDLETCVAETVRRQLRRPFCRPALDEEQVIRTRFPIYAALPLRKVATMRALGVVVAELEAIADARSGSRRRFRRG
jgi:shikimate kinase